MKRFAFILATAIFLAACNDKTADEKTTNDKKDEKTDTTKMANISYPYKAEYSSDVKMGDPNHSKLVLDFFKAWEENRMDDMKPMLTDSVWVEFSDGNKFNGTADSLIKTGKGFRASFASVRTTIDVWMPVHLNDRNEDYVLVWGKDYNTSKTGKVDSTSGHSYWQIKNNKISGWAEFSKKLGVPPPPPPKKK
jgi:ketosteroid isomerase-like protein